MGDYQGSQAFARVDGAKESVNQNTGSLSYVKTLIDLRGVQTSIDLKMDLYYSAGTKGTYGLPANWSLNIPYVSQGKSVTFNRRTWVIDQFWTDTSNYQSGLRYNNNHGLKFLATAQSAGEAVPFAPELTYRWSLRSSDGSTDYFDPLGRLIEHGDVYGNRISYRYTDDTSPPEKARLASITDSWQQTVRFAHQPGLYIKVTDPNGAETRVAFSSDGVTSVTDSRNHVTSFTYSTFASQKLIATIKHPTGLTSRLTYQALKYLDAGGASRDAAAVMRHDHADPSGKHLSRTSYIFGGQTGGANFSGSSINCRLKDDSDSLMDSNRTDYRYDVLVYNLDSDGTTVLSAYGTWFNYLHLPMEVSHYAVGSGGRYIKAFQDNSTFDIAPDKHARSVNYSQPVIFEQYRVATSGSRKLLRRVETSYDLFGGMLDATEKISADSSSSALVPVRSTHCTYTKTPWGGAMLASQTNTDALLGMSRRIQYTLTDDKKNVHSAILTYKSASNPDYQPWKTKSYTFDGAGRMTSEKIAWSAGVAIPSGTPSSYSHTMSHTFDAAGGAITISVKDPAGNQVSSSYSTRLPGGPLLAKTLPLQQAERFEYDSLGRPVKHVDPFGNITTKLYVNGSSENSTTTVNALGYMMKTFNDPLGRVTRQSDNGDPTKPVSNDPSRTLSLTEYDMLSRVSAHTDDLGLVTKYDRYDSFGRLLQKTDPNGNQSRWEFDDDALTRRDLANDQLRALHQFDVRGRPVSQVSYGDSIADPTLTYSVKTGYEYDSYDNVINMEKILQPLDGSSSTVLWGRARTYDSEFSIESEMIQGKPDSMAKSVSPSDFDTCTRRHQRDIFGNVYQQTKETEYSSTNSKFVHKGSKTIYDSRGHLVICRNGLDQEEQYTYDGNGHLSSMKRYDGTIQSYSADALGRTVAASIGSNSLTRTYAANTRLTQVESNGEATRYSYSLDGGLKSVASADGAQQQYTLDQFSRITASTDGFGVGRSQTYDALGRISTRQCQSDTITYEYGTANHVQGLPIGDKLVGTQQKITRTISYDGYGRISHVVVGDKRSGKIILDTGYAYDALGRLKVVELSSQVAPSSDAVNYSRRFEYDGLGQVSKDQIQYTSGTSRTSTHEYLYDGNSNITNSIIDGVPNLMTFNAIDQRTDNGITYDTNGRLQQDASGARYEFNKMDQLTSVSPSGGNSVAYQFSPEGSLIRREEGGQVTSYLYDNGAVNAVQAAGSAQDGKKSYFLEPERRVSAYQNSSNGGTVDQYFIDNQGSTSLTITSGGGDSTTSYDAYGNPHPSTGSMAMDDFGYKQEWADTRNGLVYLRSRFYQPDLRSFITMDSTRKENRYAFCAGDPINFMDPSGHSAESVAVGIGLLVAVVVSFLVSEGATAGIDAILLSAFFEGSTAALEASVAATVGTQLGAGVAAGIAGNFAGDAVTHAISHDPYTGEDALADFVSGLAGGVTEYGVGEAVSRGLTKALTRADKWAARTISSVARWGKAVVGGASGGFALSTTSAAVLGEDPFTPGTGWGTLSGAVGGALGGAREEIGHVIRDKRVTAAHQANPPPALGPGEYGPAAPTLQNRLDAIKVRLRTNASGLPPSSFPALPTDGGASAGSVPSNAQVPLSDPVDDTTATGGNSYLARIRQLASHGGLGDAQQMADAVRLQVFAPYTLSISNM